MKLSVPALTLLIAFVGVGCDSSASVGLSTTAAAVINRDAELTTFRGVAYGTSVMGSLNSSQAEVTVLAATNDAFTNSASDFDLSVGDIVGRPDIEDILFVHVIDGEMMAADLTDGQEIMTRAGTALTVVVEADRIGFDANADGTADAYVSTSDIDASNGVVHKVDRVFVPAQ